MVTDKPVYLTAEGKTALEDELNHLKAVRRPEVADRIQQAKLDGDVSESGEYEDAKNEQAMVEGRIRTLEHMLQNAQIIEETKSDVVVLGTRVKVRDGEGTQYEWTIVGSAEANPRDSKISNESPVGKALMGKKKGDKVSVDTPGGVEEFSVLKVG
ncbi:MAG TPA: transcription elongation factor GreA [Chloroflexia bacterium]|nr:transcription elongation factor GreA [Chloroflexia bacterium]